MSVKNNELFEALLTIKQYCLENYNDEKCNCPCANGGFCKVIECSPKEWNIQKREVFF